MTSMFSAQARAEVVSNLLVNPGFESSNAGWTEFGSNGQPVDNINYEFGLGSGPQEGSLSLKLFQQFSGQPNEAGVYQDIAVMPNSRYELSGYLRNGNGSTQFMDYLDGPNAAFLRIVWLDSGLLEISRIDNNVPPQGITAATPQDNAWLFNQLQVESPANAATARVMAVHKYSGFSFEGGSSWFDDLQFGVAVPEPSTLFLVAFGCLPIPFLTRQRINLLISRTTSA